VAHDTQEFTCPWLPTGGSYIERSTLAGREPVDRDCVAVAVFRDESLAVQVTVLVPFGSIAG